MRFGQARRIAVWPLLAAIGVYRYAISPLLGASCRFQPTCSEYARDAIRDWGVVQGGWLAVRRIARCHPFAPGGYDPPPPSPDKGEPSA